MSTAKCRFLTIFYLHIHVVLRTILRTEYGVDKVPWIVQYMQYEPLHNSYLSNYYGVLHHYNIHIVLPPYSPYRKYSYPTIPCLVSPRAPFEPSLARIAFISYRTTSLSLRRAGPVRETATTWRRALGLAKPTEPSFLGWPLALNPSLRNPKWTSAMIYAGRIVPVGLERETGIPGFRYRQPCPSLTRSKRGPRPWDIIVKMIPRRESSLGIVRRFDQAM